MNTSNEMNPKVESYGYMTQALRREEQAIRHVFLSIGFEESSDSEKEDLVTKLEAVREREAVDRLNENLCAAIKPYATVRRVDSLNEIETPTGAKRSPLSQAYLKLRSPVTIADRSELSPCGSQSQINGGNTSPKS